jgi:hypothetical protein
MFTEWIHGFALKDYATAISIFVTTLLAVLVTYLHNRFQARQQRAEFAHQKLIKQKESHAALRLKAIDVHESFWNSEKMFEARQMISNEDDYQELEKILIARLQDVECKLKAEQYEKLELVDRFYSGIMRLRRLQGALLTFGDDADSDEMIRDCYGYWVEILDRPKNNTTGRGDRIALRDYLSRFWPGIVGGLPKTSTFGALSKRTNNPMDRSGGSAAS